MKDEIIEDVEESVRTEVRTQEYYIPFLESTHIRWNAEIIPGHPALQPRWHVIAVDKKQVSALIRDAANALRRNGWVDVVRAYRGVFGKNNVYNIWSVTFDSDSKIEGFKTDLYEILKEGSYGVVDVRNDNMLLRERRDPSIPTSQGVPSTQYMNHLIERRYKCNLSSFSFNL